ncbi:uncharacterized protein V6R79_000867 [Siganus canaliculatus]
MVLSSRSCAEAKTKVTVSCPEDQRAFGASCYEFVDVQRSFSGAQRWCERRGGHLAFIPDEQTQYFLQSYLDSTRDIWFGAASPGFTNVKYSPAAEAPLSWLSGSYITYSNWMSTPEPGSACAHTLRDTHLQWEATKDCSKELPFVCQHESGSSTACAGHDTRLQCGSGQVLMIDGAFYGRKSVHFCRITDSTHATITAHQCGWVDVNASIAARCSGHQVCHLAQLAASFDDLCPPLGSYLSVDYHCTDGLVLSVNAAAAVFADVSIGVKWLLELQQGNLSCELSTGDGAVFYLNSSDRLDSSVLHKYMYAGTFVVAVECNLKDTHITAEEIIIIEEPVGEFGLLICYAGKQSFHMTKCNVLYGEQFQIQMEVKAGTNVTYRLQSDEMCLASLSVVRGNVPQNITVTAEMVERLEPGCHQLTLSASNKVTLPEVSAHLQMCVREEVAGLRASVLTESIDCRDSPGFTVAVSLQRGAPVTLLFSLSGGNSSVSETRKMNTRREIFHIQHPVKGSVRIQLGAWNVFSSLETHVFASCGSDSVFRGKKRQIRQIPTLEIVSTPAASVTKRQAIVLSIADASTLTDPTMRYQWSCTNPCKCQGQYEGLTHTISQSCLPDPLAYDKYHFSIINRANNNVEKTQSICISFGLTKVQESTASLRCTQGCDPVESNKDVKIKLTCSGQCSNAKWYVEDIEDQNQWPSETRSCYTDAETSPYTKENDGGESLKVKKQMISQAMTNGQNIAVVVMSEDELLRCSESKDLQFVFLPLGDNNADYNLVIRATAKSSSFSARTTITAQVIDPTDESNDSIGDLTAAVDNVVAQLMENNALSGETVGQVFHSVSEKLNSQSDGANKEARRRLREQMLDIITSTLKQVPSRTPAEVEATARGLGALIQEGSELSSAAQEEASLLFENLSSSLLQMGVNNSEAIHSASSLIVAGASNILDYSSNKNVSDNILAALTNTESALLAFKNVDEEPTIIQQAHISMMVSRVTPGNLHKTSINIPNSSSPAFSLPKFPAKMLPSHEPVDIRMRSLDKNPFSWNKRGNISGTIGALSLTTKAGSSIPVKDLSEDIEIMLPSLAGHEVNTSFLDLGNFSTTVIELTSANSTLVLKMVPSYDPLPIKLFLGFMEYPTDQSHVAMTEMPHKGRTQEERYTWILEPEKLQGNIGVYYLVVRPIVGPGIKSINATLSITTITTACKFWDEAVLDWRTYGCRVGVQTTPLVTQCLCNHLTFFGSSFFVTPNLVDPSRTAELFASFAENPVVVCFVGALFVAYFVVVVWARRKDTKDATKVKVTVLEDNNPVDEHRYLLSVSTGHRRGAATSSQVTITLLGTEGNSEPHHLSDPEKSVFERGAVDLFLLTTPFSLGDLQGIRLWHNNSGSHPDWYVGNVMVQDLQTEQKFHFLCNSWLGIDMDDSSLDQVFQVSTEMDLKRFSNLFFMKTSKDFSDGHLWYSVISRPPSSTFTCVQRVSCCFSLLLCTMLTSIMFYGIPSDPSEQTMDLGHFEFTWQQFMIGVQSSLIMFPINILIVSVFRNTRPRETSCCRSKKEKDNILEQPSSSETNTNVSLEIVTKEIKRIAQSLSKALKSTEKSELQPGQHVDINDVLSTMEDFIKHTHKTAGDTLPSKTMSVPNLVESPEGSLGTSGASAVEGVQKKTDKTQYLYRQLCHIDKRLSQLEPSSFPNPHSHSRALLQVQGMKGFLEDQLCHPDLQTEPKSNPTDGTDSDGSQDQVPVKKRACCHGGLPWWFIFFGWLLVIATSVVSGYFTMLYGLKFGRERSISWLVSMIVSFFQSILIIQPLKVICLAVFFALVLKNFEEEDYRNVALEGSDQNKGDFMHQHTIRKDERLYEPPPPGDVEKMRRKKILEKKAFAILVEILTYMGFLWMLLLVAYGQRDPNAFFLNQHIRTSFSKNISDSMSLGDVFTWANTCLLRNLFGVHSGFITDGNSKLVGNARLRQLRVQRSSCELDQSMIHFVPDCLAPYSWEAEDMGSYSPGWNQSLTDDNSTRSIPWTYHTQTELRAHPVWGNMALYRGGGFVAELGPDFHNASSTLEYLFRNKWLDQYTRVIFVEFTVYNANVNLFCIVTLSFESTATGAFQFSSDLQSVRLYQSTGGLYIFVMAAEILYMLFILYYMFIQAKLLKQQRWAYFRSKRNLVELTIILLSWSAVAVFITRTLLGNRDMAYYHNHRDQFASFYETALTDLLFHYLIAVLVLLATIKLWHLLRLNPKMNMITATLQRAWSDICSFLVVIVILLVAYSIVCNLIYGWRRSSYRSFTSSLMTIISLQIGIFNYDEVLNGSPLLGGFLIGSCVIFVTFVVLNLLVSVILVAFNQEQICHKPSDEEEIVDLLLKKICSFFGVGYKNKNTAMSDVNEGNGFTLNNGRDICNNPSPDGNVSQKSENSVNP